MDLKKREVPLNCLTSLKRITLNRQAISHV
jgi:hypothetical protein